ncbi:MAG TPA: 4-(cytidine 5'-diphospho)-2-C-methyl-D-erythritol kinase [Methylomusa anaerophila]|uniref:4-diphosphocytidyl-2-C-methyl-D-erythritol kinase n=1 Tax=Methylomusa anaerophila TaxID=1930071 RepID=A0A348AGW0_9FIRM|nr:4-(cytidine 5'-diphospho)-2-C-methyl-D-erythritol kinase [Methylomusa anaerophila]BBB90308.1 4-diphosphocytidyl-2-C-methyl-D-erythritol kinase [Methylomusa anaerophila]HML89346.1 4-(cytidine 5'-diphospho)-2-C-methyl-D-erythritol kinase [Methylomusa anaerophila]
MLKVKAYAKINLALDVLHKRSDGYHEVAMIMQAIDLADTVTLSDRAEAISVSVNIPVPGLPADQSNLAYRAAALIREECQVSRGVHIALEKRIPMAAGLAGGSADAAAVLRGLNSLWGLGLSLAELSHFGARLGSDVPFCLYGGTMLATGRGERLTPLPAMPESFVVLAKPPVAVSTAWAYGQYRAESIPARPDINAMRARLAAKDLKGIAALVGNVLESVTIPSYPEIAVLKEYMLQYGALTALMSGSGPTVFALAADAGQAEYIVDKMRNNKEVKAEFFMAKTLAKVE